jgi:hypothetical protein
MAIWGSGALAALLVVPAQAAGAADFGAPVSFAAGLVPLSIATVDVNRDGRPDLVTGNGSDSVSVLLNRTPDGGAVPVFAPTQTVPTGQSEAVVAAGDFNDDGAPDLAVADQEGGGVTILLNRTARGAQVARFAAPTIAGAGSGPYGLAAGDLNGDGEVDLVTADYGLGNGSTVSVLLGHGDGTFAAPQTLAAGPGPDFVVLPDVNGDGRPDVAVANFNTLAGNNIDVWLNATPPGAATVQLTAESGFATGPQPAAIAVSDLDGDGRPDLAAAYYGLTDSGVTALTNTTDTGGSAPNFRTQPFQTSGGVPNWVAAGDFDGDGRPDLVTADTQPGPGGPALIVLMNDGADAQGTLGFAPGQPFVPNKAGSAVVADDLNGDGKPDLAAATGSPAGVSVLFNAAQAHLAAAPADFGAQALGTIGTARTLTVTDNGDYPTRIDSVRSSGADFLVARDGCTGVRLTAGASCSVDVRFAPSAAGPRTAALEVAGDDPALAIPLSGTGAVLQAGPPAPGPAGPAGSAGPAGTAGKAGQVELVTCRTAGHRTRCTTRRLGPTATFTLPARATAALLRGRKVVATGSVRHGRLTLRSARRLPAGRYTLRLRYRRAGHTVTLREAFTLP